MTSNVTNGTKLPANSYTPQPAEYSPKPSPRHSVADVILDNATMQQTEIAALHKELDALATTLLAGANHATAALTTYVTMTQEGNQTLDLIRERIVKLRALREQFVDSES